MSLVKSKAIQLGFDATPTNNFLIYQPLTPDGTFRIANGNQGATTDIMTVTSGGSVTFAGTTNFSSLNFGAGSESAPSLFPTGDSNTGVWFPAADTFAVSTGGAERLRIASGGNVGIGQTNPVYKLDVNRGSAGNIVRFTDGVAQTLVIQSPDANGIKIKNDNNGYLSFAGTSAEWMRIDSSGNVGIGTNSPSTYGNFVVNNSATSGTSTDNSIAYVRSVNRNAVICLDGGSNNAAAVQFYQGGVATGHIRYWNSGTINANCITFGGKGADSEIMRLDANGEVQIGNTSAYGTLTIQRKANAPYATLTIGDISTSTNTVGIYLRQSGTSPAGISTAGAPLAFFTGSPGLNEAMRINSNGTVGINNSNPEAAVKAQISGSNNGGVLALDLTASSSESSRMSAGNYNNMLVLRSAFGPNPAVVNNSGAKWGIAFYGGSAAPGANYPLVVDGNFGKSAGIYAISEDPGAGYNRRVGLSFHTSPMDGNMSERMRIDADGRVSVANQPSFSVFSMQWRNLDTWNGGSVLVNKGGMSYNSSNGVLTVPAAGTYIIHAHMLYYSASNSAQMVLRINGAFQDEGFSNTGTSNAGLQTVSLMTIRNLAAGDTVSIYANGSGWYTNATGNTFSVVMVN